MATKSGIYTAAREFAFDRFVTPTFYITSVVAGDKLTITATELVIKDSSDVERVNLDYATYSTLKDLLDVLVVNSNFRVSYSSSFIGSEPSTSLAPVTDSIITNLTPAYRKYFFSDTFIDDISERYLLQVMTRPLSSLPFDYDEEIEAFDGIRDKHMALWVAYHLLERRRLYEMAGEIVGESFSTQSGEPGLVGMGDAGGSVNVQIGDVFSLSEGTEDRENPGELYWRVGADNVLGDARSFWYRLQLWIRDQMEQQFGDTSLRKDTVIHGNIALEKDQNFYSYFDQYPYTLSPLSREILSSVSYFR